MPRASDQNKKRKVSGKRGKAATRKRRASNAVSADHNGILGLILLAVGVLAFVSIVLPTDGTVLFRLELLLRGLGGQLCLLFPLLLCILGFYYLLGGTWEVLNRRNIVCGTVVFVLIETILQTARLGVLLPIMNVEGAPNYLSFLINAFRDSMNTVRGGGFIGALLAWPLQRAFSAWGAQFISAVGVLIALMVATGVSVGPLGNWLSDVLDDWRISMCERREQVKIDREERDRERMEQRQRELERREAEEARLREEAKRLRQEDRKPAQQEVPKPEPEPAQTPAPEPAPIFETPDIGSEQPPLYVIPTRPVGVQNDLYIASDEEFVRASTQTRLSDSGFTKEEEIAAFRGGALPEQEAQSKSEELAWGPYAAQPKCHQEDEAEDEMQEPILPNALAGMLQEEPEKQVETKSQVSLAVEEEEPAFDNGTCYVPDALDEPPRRRRRRVPAPSAPSDLMPSPAMPRNGSAPEEARPIVQLRESRLDATPVVVPRKSEHAAAEPAQVEYHYPSIELLDEGENAFDPQQEARDLQNGRKLIEVLQSFSVRAELRNCTHGPAITRYEIQPAPGVKVSRITTLADDIALNLASDGVRIEAPVPGKPVVGIEVPNRHIEMVRLREVLGSETMKKEKSATAVALGKSISGSAVVADLAKMPHVLIAGATGSGKSVCINTIIQSVIFRAKPEEVRLILIDPKVVELSVYNGIPHLLIPVVTDPKKASAALAWAVAEMEQRYKRFETMGVRDIKGYNAAIGEDEQKMPKIIVIIDELADLMMVAPGEVEDSICRLAQLARAAGIHLVIATQRPSVNVITGVIKANIPSRIAFAVSSQIDSRTILDGSGAEKLLGKGDMLYAPQGANKPTRVQGCFVTDDEVQKVVSFVKQTHREDYNTEVIEQLDRAASEEKGGDEEGSGGGDFGDEMFVRAIDLAVDAGQVSISMLQRRLRVGYARAGRLVDEMTARGITAESEGTTKPRKVLITREEWNRMQDSIL